ncbi:MAG TPA: hypothetical protein VGJ76_10655 [Pseudolabrys sp.]|jgi:hypothetical protein
MFESSRARPLLCAEGVPGASSSVCPAGLMSYLANVCFEGKSGHQVQYAGHALDDLFLKSHGAFPAQD